MVLFTFCRDYFGCCRVNTAVANDRIRLDVKEPCSHVGEM